MRIRVGWMNRRCHQGTARTIYGERGAGCSGLTPTLTNLEPLANPPLRFAQSAHSRQRIRVNRFRGAPRRLPPHPHRHTTAAQGGGDSPGRWNHPCRPGAADGHHHESELFGPQRYGPRGAPVAHHGPPTRVVQHPMLPARTAAREAPGCQQHERCGGQQGQEDAQHAQGQGHCSRQQPQRPQPAGAGGDGWADRWAVRRCHGRHCGVLPLDPSQAGAAHPASPRRRCRTITLNHSKPTSHAPCPP